jgi:hypothetical protein
VQAGIQGPRIPDFDLNSENWNFPDLSIRSLGEKQKNEKSPTSNKTPSPAKKGATPTVPVGIKVAMEKTADEQQKKVQTPSPAKKAPTPTVPMEKTAHQESVEPSTVESLDEYPVKPALGKKQLKEIPKMSPKHTRSKTKQNEPMQTVTTSSKTKENEAKVAKSKGSSKLQTQAEAAEPWLHVMKR